ncbi:MAG: DUF2079 domain-containing protein [Verrucomicrobiia bacterium]
MIAASAVPLSVDKHPLPIRPWRLILLIMAAVNLAAFWFLLQYNYLPENYHALPIGLDRAELAWIGISICVAIVAIVLSWRNADTARRFVWAGLLATVISMVVLVKTLAGAPLRCLDPILFSAALGWGTVFWLRTNKALDLDRTLSLRLGDRCWHPKIVNVLAAVVWISAIGLFLYYMAQQIYYLNNLALGYADCGENARLMFNTMTNPRELFLRVNPDKPLFYDHFHPGILPFMPLWLVWPDLKLTIVLQLIAVLGVVVPLYYIGQRVFQDDTPALLLVLAWLVYPSTSQFVYSASYGFRWGNMCLLFYFTALAFWLNGRSGWALLMVLWAMLIKEEAAIIVGMFGVYLALFERRRAAGIALAVFAFGFFLLVTSILVPDISGREYGMTRFFYDLGHTKLEILLSPITKPGVFWGKLFEPSSLYFGAVLIAPLLFLPVRKPSVLFIGTLTFVFCCMHPILKNICFHYQAALLPVVFWALAAALRTDDRVWQRAALSGAIVSGILLSLFFGNTFWSKDTILVPLSPGRLQRVQRMARHIDPHGSLFATQRVAAHFITQKYLYLDPPLPSSIDYVLLDLRDIWRETRDVSWLRKLCALQRQVEARPDLHLVDAEDGLLLYAQHGNMLDPRTVVERDSLPPDAVRQDLHLGGGVGMVGYTIVVSSDTQADTEFVRITTFSTVAAPTNTELAARCILEYNLDSVKTDAYISKLQPLGQGILPIARWEANKFYADVFLFTLPRGLSDKITRVRFACALLTN